ncbi:hypothetical protein PENSTE_c002G00491 [Penicillium steckii]|uniref:Uncharacterized protein n=1 Tax=Penicillium steckii TaxID=303698 RepID=A0A1V6TU55_9EURO|nr:hypothetical protein PENSTE_c002G00491 [Penicillium steckii]
MNSIIRNASLRAFKSPRTLFPTQKRAATTTTGEPVPYGGYPLRMIAIVGAGAGTALYLWNRGHANAKAGAVEDTQAHHGPNKAQVQTPGDSSSKKERA